MNNRISIATIDSPEFINLQQMDINPLMSKCDIKVLYIGQNRNRSCITKSVATEMSKTLRGCPIVGYYIDNKEDFGDHGDQVIIDAEGVKFNKLTKPYGFIAPDAKVWFQFFEDQDEFGNACVREYLMTEGYLWTGQFEECQRVIENHNPQSMELDEKTLKGHWSTDSNKGVDFFIINDAIFSKLCILGEDVEPCFEGAGFAEPILSSNFSKNDDFTNSLFTMMNELKYALNNSKGGTPMSVEIIENKNELDNTVESVLFENQDNVEAEKESENLSVDPVDSLKAQENVELAGDLASITQNSKKEEEEEEEEKPESEETDDKEEDEDDEEKKKKFALENEISELHNQITSLTAERDELLAFKKRVEDKEKDDLIKSFYMLSDEDKKDIIENKDKYTLKEIKAELSVLCVDKRVNFSLEEETPAKENVVTFNLNSHQVSTLPAWLQAVETCKEKMNK